MILESPHFEDHTPVFTSHRVLGSLATTAITLLVCSGSPIGSEPVISSAGPLIGMAGFIFYPLLITIPFANIVAELCSAFPEDGGFTIWVFNAFGPFWGFQVGYWSLISSVLNGALLPGVIVKLFTDYYKTEIESAVAMWVIKAAIAVALTVPPLLGTVTVGRLSVLLCAVVFLSFLVFTIWAYSVATDFDDLFEIRHAITEYNPETRDVVLEGDIAVDWATLVNTLYWSYDGMVMISVFGGEILNPARVYPRAIMVTVMLMLVTYAVPMPAALSSDSIHWSLLTEDSYPLLASDIGGSFLQCLVVVAAVCANAGAFVTSTYTQAFQTAGMAEHVLLPEVLARRSERFQAPYVSVLVTLVLTLPLLSLEYEDLLPMTNAFSAAVNILVIATAFQLRRKLPYIPRPAKVPGGTVVLAAIAVLPTAIMCYITYEALTESLTALIILVSIVPGLAYGAYQLYRHRNATMGW